jgi:hypothetical protein
VVCFTAALDSFILADGIPGIMPKADPGRATVAASRGARAAR